MQSSILTMILFIIIYFQFVDAQRTMSIEDVLKIENENGISFYCKNDICVETDLEYSDMTVDIPDEHGNVTTYIAGTCTDIMIEQNICESIKCYDDSDCLSNKCKNRYCAYNQEDPMTHCDSVYKNSLGNSLYMHCGKAWGYNCQSDNECSSKMCDNGCTKQMPEYPYLSDNIWKYYLFTYLLIWVLPLVIIIGISICCCRYYKKKAKDKYQNYNIDSLQ